jgi:hypothetical protein
MEAGGLMVYAPQISEMHQHAATYVDKILKGADPPISRWSNRRS